ncbi:MAG: hypothetical protein WC600_01905 [Desulfobaccales bacterium]
MKKILFLMLLIVAFAVVPVQATEVVLGQWYEFEFGVASSFAFNGDGCIPSDGDNSVAAPNPPWTYTTNFPIGSQVTIVDAFAIGDVFQLYDGGAAVGATTFVANTGVATGISNPDLALLNAALSRGVFGLDPGAHSLDIEIIRNALETSGGCAYFRVDPCGIPVPPTVYLLGSSLLGLVGLRFRRNLV